MNLTLSFLTVVAATAVAIAALLWIRHRSPQGGHFGDTSRAAGVFSILATTFAVLFAFVVLLSFNAYEKTRTGAETESETVVEQFETVQFLPPSVGPQLSGELICYSRAVVYQEWPRMISGDPPEFNSWRVPLFLTFEAVHVTAPDEQEAYGQWLDESAAREQAREDRIHGASGIVPAPLWFTFLITAGIVWGFVFFFADRSERALIQAMQIGAVTAMLASSLLLVRFLDRPFHAGAGSIKPTAMEHALGRMAATETAFKLQVPELCDAHGQPTAAGAALASR